MNTTVYILGILLQLVAGVIALLQVRSAPRKLPWLLIALSSLLIVFRRSATIGQFLNSGQQLAAAEVLTLIISLLFFAGAVFVTRMFRDAREDASVLRDFFDSSGIMRGVVEITAGHDHGPARRARRRSAAERHR